MWRSSVTWSLVQTDLGAIFVDPDAYADPERWNESAARIRAEVARRVPDAVVLDAQTVPSIDISAVRALDTLADDLERSGVRFAIARDVGQVRDVMAGTARPETVSRLFPTVRAAVAALGGGAADPEAQDDPPPSPDRPYRALRRGSRGARPP